MASWTIHDTRRKQAASYPVDTNAEAIWCIADSHSEDVFAVNNSTHERMTFESGVLGDSTRVWDLYDAHGRQIRDVNNYQAFKILCKNAMDAVKMDTTSDDVWLVNVNNLSERLRWNTEKDWFEVYTA